MMLQVSRSSFSAVRSNVPPHALRPPATVIRPPSLRLSIKSLSIGTVRMHASFSEDALEIQQDGGEWKPSCPPAFEATPQGSRAREEEDVLRSILNLVVPALGAVLSDPVMSLIDTGCVGQVGSIQLAALGPNTSIFNFVFQIFTFLGAATCNLLASIGLQASTSEDQQLQASKLLSHALVLAVLSGLAVIIIMELFAEQLLGIMGTGKDYLEPALIYLRVRALSAPAVLVLIVGQGACLGRQDARTPLAINTMAAAFNVVGDVVLTLRLGWGVAGAAWATLFSQYFAVVLLVRALTRMSLRTAEQGHDEPQQLPLQVRWYGLPTLEVLGPFLTLAGPLVLRCALGMAVYTLMAKAAASSGTLSMAAHQVAMQVFWTLSYIPESLSIAAQSLVACHVKTKPKRAQAVARMLLGFAIVVGVLLMGCVASVHYFGASWLTSDERVRQLVKSVTLQSMLCELLCAMVIVIEGIAIACGDFAYLPRMQFLNLGGVLFALALTFRNNWGLKGIWWCLVLYFGTRFVYHFFYIQSHWNSHVLGAAATLAVDKETEGLVAS